ncbi:hypothetical protein HETIRDRAFT_424604 [Heterobasidion irregulare TC 32-1]|uniref:Uncharacterized protein n=1 Tax=Heterobasidion irregulare (strain TC 32-1) TaxID=747525 RepID=W4KH97_HETIT|nr:uncharacterized protein HETIRDRAFT_424604 [Heterobasidion irregulare TC 32-1]ETW85212.1 hypothetical protein HETIRDRAFT_424604 [Heterobasidion irregulare TC 32-1]
MVLTTRPTNASRHPGAIILVNTRKRRSKAEMAKEKQVADAAAAASAEEKSNVISKIAMLEKRLNNEERVKQQQVARPQGRLANSNPSWPANQSAIVQTHRDDQAIDENNQQSDKDMVLITHKHVKAPTKISRADIQAATDRPLVALANPSTKLRSNADKNIVSTGKRGASAVSTRDNERVVKKAKPAHPSGLKGSWCDQSKVGLTRPKTADTTKKPPTMVLRSTNDIQMTRNDLPSEQLNEGAPEYAPGGFAEDEEDEDEERAVVRKEAKRTTSSTIVKIEPNRTSKPKYPQGGQPRMVKKEKAKIEDLPAGSYGRWLTKFIPSCDGFQLAGQMQKVWDEVYPDIPHTIEARGDTFHLAQQKVYEWRSFFGSIAIDVVTGYFNRENLHTSEARKQVRGIYSGSFGEIPNSARQVPKTLTFTEHGRSPPDRQQATEGRFGSTWSVTIGVYEIGASIPYRPMSSVSQLVLIAYLPDFCMVGQTRSCTIAWPPWSYNTSPLFFIGSPMPVPATYTRATDPERSGFQHH